MRWDDLFDDLESQLEHELGAEAVDLRAEEERLRLGRLGLRDRLAALLAAGGVVRLALRDGEMLALTPGAIGKDWVAGRVATGERPDVLLPIEAIASIVLAREQLAASCAGGGAAENERSLSARLGLSFVLRDLCRRRRTVELRGERFAVTGTIDRVGRDHLDLAVHDAADPRRERMVAHHRVVPFAQIVLVRY